MPPRSRSPIDKAKAYEVVWNQVGGLFDAARTFDGACFIYLIGEQDDGPFKIGFSKDPIGRLRTMQTGNPRRLRIEYVLLGDMALEKLLHELWESYAILSSASKTKPGAAPGTEWFRPEAREGILPIFADATQRQIAYLGQWRPAYHMAALERIVRNAHSESGLVVQGRDEVRNLARTVGYAIPRPSRL